LAEVRVGERRRGAVLERLVQRRNELVQAAEGEAVRQRITSEGLIGGCQHVGHGLAVERSANGIATVKLSLKKPDPAGTYQAVSLPNLLCGVELLEQPLVQHDSYGFHVGNSCGA
jgi:hypothetical protein